jgi:hypothetical protein
MTVASKFDGVKSQQAEILICFYIDVNFVKL